MSSFKIKIIVVFGTRPEFIKLAPLIRLLSSKFQIKICCTGQHKEMIHDLFKIFNFKIDYFLNLMSPNQNLSALSSLISNKLNDIFIKENPDLVVVHGDTLTTFVASYVAFFNKIKIAHIEAGLRSYDLLSPWPEEANRRITSLLANFHFAPTSTSKNNLIQEGINSDTIFISGNTAIDSVIWCSKFLKDNIKERNIIEKKFSNIFVKFNKIVLITGHRRENFGSGFENICSAIKRLAYEFDDICFIYPVHLNPNVQTIVNKKLADIKNIILMKPLNYIEFIYVMENSYLVLTDSGGIQEEAPTLNIPVLLMRNNTERPEGVLSGAVKLIGTNSSSIYKNVSSLLMNSNIHNEMSKATNPFGNGNSSTIITNHLVKLLQK